MSESAVSSIKSAFLREHSKPTNVPLVLREDMSAETMTVQAADAQFMQARSYSIDDVCRIYGLPAPSLLGSFEGGVGYNSDLAALNKAYADKCLANWAAIIQAEVEFKLDVECFKFALDEISRGSFAAQVDALTKATGGGLLTVEEARQRLGVPATKPVSSDPGGNSTPSVAAGGEEEEAGSE